MKISKIHLTNFKRFTDVRIENISDSVKLVLLIGSNGSGKSSLFDAFGFVDASIKQDVGHNEEFWNYFRKKSGEPVTVNLGLHNDSEFTLTDADFRKPELPTTSFYGRTSFRQIPRLTRTTLGQGGLRSTKRF